MEWKRLLTEFNKCQLFATRFAEQQARMKDFIPGTYQREREDFGIRVAERLVIQTVSNIADIYCIKKIVCLYNSPEEKKIYEPKTDEWMASYDFAQRRLQELVGSRSCAFIPEDSLMLLDGTKYSKIGTSKCLEF
jgi:hypothetical protein